MFINKCGNQHEKKLLQTLIALQQHDFDQVDKPFEYLAPIYATRDCKRKCAPSLLSVQLSRLD